jgi:hypothetical protein
MLPLKLARKLYLPLILACAIEVLSDDSVELPHDDLVRRRLFTAFLSPSWQRTYNKRSPAPNNTAHSICRGRHGRLFVAVNREVAGANRLGWLASESRLPHTQARTKRQGLTYD